MCNDQYLLIGRSYGSSHKSYQNSLTTRIFQQMVARLHCRARPSLCTPSCVHGPAAVVATAMEESRNRFLLKKNKLRPSHKPYQNSLFTKPPNNCTRDYSTRRARPSLCTPCTAQPRPSTHHARPARQPNRPPSIVQLVHGVLLHAQQLS